MYKRRDMMDTSDEGAFKKGVPMKYHYGYPRFRRKRPTVRQVQRQVNQIKQIFTKGIEIKEGTAALDKSLVADTPQYLSMCSMSQGTTGTTRVGDKITIRSLAFRGSVYLSEAPAETTMTTFRILFVVDRTPNGATSTWTNVLHNASVYSFMNLDRQYKGRYQVIYDQTFHCPIDSDFKKEFKGFKKFNLVVGYNGNAGTVADIQKNHLFMMVQSTGNTQNAELEGFFRIRYTDE